MEAPPSLPFFDPPAAVVSRLRAAYINCAETTVYNVQGRFTGISSYGHPKSVTAVGMQNVSKEERVLGLTAEMPGLTQLHVWPLGKKPPVFCISPSGLFFATVSDPASPKDTKGLLKDVFSSLTGSVRRTSVSSRLQVELFSCGGEKGGVGSVVAFSAPSDCKMPWGDEHGGSSFCLGDENLFVFTAETSDRLPGGAGIANTQPAPSKPSAPEVDSYVYEPDWGEQHQGCRLGRLYCVDFKRRTTEMLTPPVRAYAYGQPRWIPDGLGIVCTAWSMDPYCLGLQYCCNRRSKVYLARLPKRFAALSAASRESMGGSTMVTDPCDKLFSSFQEDSSADGLEWLQLSEDCDFAAWSPVVLETSEVRDAMQFVQIAYFAVEENTPEARAYQSAVQVKVVVLERSPIDPMNWYIHSRRVLSRPLDGPLPSSPGSGGDPVFSGVYSSRMSVWRDAKYLFVNTFIGCREAIACLDAISGGFLAEVTISESSFASLFQCSSLHESRGYISMKLLDTKDNWLLIECSSFVHTPRLLVGKLVEKEEDMNDKQRPSTPAVYFEFVGGTLLGGFCDVQSSMRWTPYQTLLRHLRKLGVAEEENRHLLLFWGALPSPDRKRALAVVLHGGPHSVACCRFSPEAAFLSMMGYNVLFVNYKGSLGFGQQELLSLLGNIGTDDVIDVANAVKGYLSKHEGMYDETKTVLCGGSHGGFLVCHLLGQFPNLFAAAATRNPVTNLLTMLSGSDIPDWTYAEVLNSDFDPTLVLEPEQVLKYYNASPIVHAKHIATPLLLAVGGKDERVRMSSVCGFSPVLPGSRQKFRRPKESAFIKRSRR